jgi:GTP-binding protein Era
MTQETDSMPFRSGFVALIGPANAGKSTLVNRLVGRKVAIVTSRPQTTRIRVLGIVNRPDAQIVLIDTPGLYRDGSALGRQMSDEVSQAIEAIDLLAVMIDASQGLTREARMAFKRAGQFRGKKVLLLNKIDRMAKPALLPLLEACGREGAFEEMIPISALSGDGTAKLIERFLVHMPEGEPYFPQDQFTDQPERFWAAEIVREKIMEATRHEIPYSVAVFVESFEDRGQVIHISAIVQAERESQKGILIGRAGERLKQVGTLARKELEGFFGVKVFIDLRVKVEREWRDDPQQIKQLDWRQQIK